MPPDMICEINWEALIHVWLNERGGVKVLCVTDVVIITTS